tara:strand:- start:424 stop:714 length:291 start_codon:yes stop_codon:yes gene_type:complete
VLDFIGFLTENTSHSDESAQCIQTQTENGDTLGATQPKGVVFNAKYNIKHLLYSIFILRTGIHGLPWIFTAGEFQNNTENYLAHQTYSGVYTIFFC